MSSANLVRDWSTAGLQQAEVGERGTGHASHAWSGTHDLAAIWQQSCSEALSFRSIASQSILSATSLP